MRRKRFIVVICSLLLILGGYFLYKFNSKPQMTIIVTFDDVPPIIHGLVRGKIEIYYRGYQVGNVSKITLSDDQKHILFYLDINYKNLKIPKNAAIILKTEDLFGARFFSISYPKYPSSQLLSDGDVIKGTASYERIDKYLIDQFETGKLKILIKNLIDLTSFMNNILKTNKGGFLNEIKKSGDNIDIILNNLRQITDDPQVKNDIKSTLNYSSRSIKNLNQILENNRESINKTISNAPESIDKTVTNLESINRNMPEVNQSIMKANDTIKKTSKIIKNTNESLYMTNCNLDVINKKVPDIPSNLLYKADNALTKFDCIGTELIDLLNERFLIFKFMFCKPGSSFQKCKLRSTSCLSVPDSADK